MEYFAPQTMSATIIMYGYPCPISSMSLYFKAFGASERALECYNKADADLNLSRADVEKQRMNSNIKRQQVMTSVRMLNISVMIDGCHTSCLLTVNSINQCIL